MGVFRRTAGALAAPADLAEQAAVITAAAAAGASFQRGLMPRTTKDQAVLTGVLVAINYGIVVTGQSAVQALAGMLAGKEASPRRFRAAAMGVEAAALAAGLALQKALPEYPSEPMARAGARSIGFRAVVGSGAGLAGLIVTDAASRARRHEVRALPVAPLAVVGAAAAATTYGLARRRQAASGSVDEHGIPVTSDSRLLVGRALGAGALVAGATFTASHGERLVAHGVAYPLGKVIPGAVARLVGHGVALGGLGAAGFLGIRKVLANADHTGAAVEAAYATQPTSEHVSGGPHSLISADDIGREGRRYVNMALTSAEIGDVTGRTDTTAPVRAFVGLDSAPTPEARADLALRELEALGGLERPLIVFYTPTGTGYVNYVVLETVEYLTGGNCAQIAMQYSLRPSPMALGEVGVGKEQNEAFLTALRARIEKMPEGERPRLLMFGESLGAQTGADTLFQGHAEINTFGIERVLFIGMPGSTAAPRHWREDKEAVDPQGVAVEVGTHEEWLALPQELRDRLRVVLLSQHDDPIVKFDMPLAVQRPGWLGPNRDPAVPAELRWQPLATFLATMIDAMNAMSVVPGTFVARGHDYRKQLAVFVRDVFGLDEPEAGMEPVERALRARELAWATRRVSAAQAEAAENAVREQLSRWGVDSDQVPPMISVPQELDPFAAT